MTRLTIFHYNDLHSHFEQWPQLVSFLQHHRTEHDLYFDLGDHADRTNPATEVTKGKVNTRLLERLNPTAVTIGNNEGITFPHEWLAALYEDVTFPVLLSNVYEEDGTRPPWAIDTQIIERDGIRIGLFGLTAPYETLYPALGWQVEEPSIAVERVLREFETCDVIILLSHLGLFADERLAEAFPQIDVILGAHTHHVLDDGLMRHGVLIAQAGKYGRYVGEVTLTFAHNQLVDKRATLHDLANQPLHDETKQSLRQEYESAERLLDVPIAETEGYPVDWFGQTPLADLLVDGLTTWCEAEVGVMPSGVILTDIASGPLTLHDIHRVCPHPINPCVLTLDGETLLRMLHDVHEESFIHLHVRGLGFRGTVLGNPSLSGIERKDGRYLIEGRPIDATATYRVATVDMFTFGPLLSYLTEQPKRYFMPELLRDILRETLMTRHPLARKG